MSEERSKIMDNLIAQDADLIEPIAQIDVDAAIEWYSPRESEWQGLLAEHFARHRLAERAAIVAWLRKEQIATESLRDEMNRFTAGYHMVDEHASALEQSANAIEAGEHLK